MKIFQDTVNIKRNLLYKLETIEAIRPFVKEAYDKLGKEKVSELKYNQTNIRREIVKKLDIANENKIVKMLNDCINYYTAIPNSTIKEKIQDIYDTLEINRKAKATDLNF